jgi:hypothetical protein
VTIGFKTGNCFKAWGKKDKTTLAKITLENKPTDVAIPEK